METSTLFDAKTLNDFKKPQLVEMILELQKEKNLLVSQAKSLSVIEDRVTELERSHHLYLQYGRRNSIEVSGIPEDVQQNDLEKHVIDIFKEAKAKVHGEFPNHMDIEACHRIGKKGVVIARFVNRKFAKEIMYKGKNLKNTKLYGDTPIYVNESLCKPFQFIAFAIRRLKKHNMIDGYRVRNGIYSIKVGEQYREISHKNDFIKHNLDVEVVINLPWEISKDITINLCCLNGSVHYYFTKFLTFVPFLCLFIWSHACCTCIFASTKRKIRGEFVQIGHVRLENQGIPIPERKT